MAMPKSELIEWLADLPADAVIGIDDGGLALRVVNYSGVYCEIGGMPEEGTDDADEK